MGRFTLRDEGKTICVGKVLKYKPYTKGVVGTLAKAGNTASANAASVAGGPVVDKSNVKETVINLETGEVKDKPKELEGIAEGDEDAE